MNTFSNNFIKDEANVTLLRETMWGPNGIRQAEELASHFPITRDMRILDLGAGLGLSALYLVKKHGCEVYSTDSYADPTDNYKRFQTLGIADKTVPMIVDATKPLPFAKRYFDVLFSIGAYNLFADNKDALTELATYVKSGGYIAAAFPGLKYDFGNDVPEEMKPFWEAPDVARTVRGIDWWQELWSHAEGIEIIEVSEMACNDIAWEEYLAIQDSNTEEGAWVLDMMKAEAGKYYNTIQLVAKVL